MGIEIQPPDINESYSDFTVVYNAEHGHKNGDALVRFGLAAVKGVGEKAVEQIISAREKVGRFHSLYNFCESVDLRAVNKQVIDALIKAGAFDSLGGSRAQMTAGLERAMQAGTRVQADIQSGQMSLFGSGGSSDDGSECGDYSRDHERLPKVQPWSEMQMLAYEKDVLGFFVSKNPLSKYADTISVYSTVNTSELCDRLEGRQVVIGGMVTHVRHIVTRNGRNAGSKMAVVKLEDLQGNCEVVLFPGVLNEYGDLVEVDKIVFVKGKVDCKREKPNIICNELVSLEEAGEKLSANLWINLNAEEVTKAKMDHIRRLCERYKGKSYVNINMTTASGYRITAIADKKLTVRPDGEFFRKLEDVVGAGNFELRGR